MMKLLMAKTNSVHFIYYLRSKLKEEGRHSLKRRWSIPI